MKPRKLAQQTRDAELEPPKELSTAELDLVSGGGSSAHINNIRVANNLNNSGTLAVSQTTTNVRELSL